MGMSTPFEASLPLPIWAKLVKHGRRCKFVKCRLEETPRLFLSPWNSGTRCRSHVKLTCEILWPCLASWCRSHLLPFGAPRICWCPLMVVISFDHGDIILNGSQQEATSKKDDSTSLIYSENHSFILSCFIPDYCILNLQPFSFPLMV